MGAENRASRFINAAKAATVLLAVSTPVALADGGNDCHIQVTRNGQEQVSNPGNTTQRDIPCNATVYIHENGNSFDVITETAFPALHDRAAYVVPAAGVAVAVGLLSLPLIARRRQNLSNPGARPVR